VAAMQVVKPTGFAAIMKQKPSMTAMFILLRFGIMESCQQAM
jgi:hypothetical protein